YHQKDTAVLRYSFFDSDSDKEQDILFLAKCGIFRLMVDDHPSLSELYKIRYNEHGGLQLNDYQKILKKRLSSLIKDVKEQEDLQLHILIPQYQGNYFSFCVMISSLKPFTRSTMDNNDTSRLFSSYDNFVIHQPDAISLHLDQMNSTELQKLFRIAYSENNNGDYEFSLSLDANGIPAFLYDEYRVELGIHEIAILQNIVNNHVTYYDMPLIQLNDRYARSIGWDMNDRIVSITEPRKIATFGNERIMVQALHILQSFYLRHQIRSIELINPKDGHRSLKEELFLVTDHNYLIITTKAKQWKKAIQNLSLQSDGKYSHDTPHYYHHIDQLGIDLIQLFHSDRNILIKLIRSWANIISSEKSAEYAYQSLLDLFDDAFKIYGLEQLSEFQLRMFLKDSTFDDLSSPELHNTLVSKYAAIFSHSFFNFKEKFDIGTNNKNRRLWKTDFLSKGIHIIDISGTTQIEQLALQSFFLILQEVRYLKNTWTFHSFDEGIRHSFEKVDQIVKEIAVNKSVLHFTHTTEMSSFLRNNDLLLFDREFDTFSVLRTFGVNSLFEKGGETNLLVHEQTNTTLLKPIEPQNLDILYDHNVLVKLSPKDIIYPHDIAPAKQVETQASTSTAQETILDHDIEDVGLGDEDAIFSQPFAEEEDNINEEYEEDNYIGPDLLFKIPVLASFRNYRQYYFQEIEFASNLPKDIVEKQLQQLISLKWIETTIKEKRDVYYPLDKGKGYIDNLMGQIPELKSVEAEIFDLVYRDLETSDDEKIIDKNNILDVLLALRLSYHNLTEYDDRKGILIKLCSLCKYISDSFAEYNDELESYYYWSLGVLAAFHGAQLASKRDEHLLIRKITEITKAISDLLTDKLQHDFTMRQVETSSDEIYVFSETMKEDEKEAQDITKDKVEAHSINRVVEKEVVSESVSKAKSPPSVMNIPKASSDAPVLERQLRPDEL
ncbi:MAG: hypothetical protein GPJ54_14495, partial [Candidatus Heimdallarchaeota archaeon]|nr:hypothetical protein [Candidatus Heimdallarchaeota archaeon]